MSPNAASMASSAPRPNQPNPIATPAPSGRDQRDSVTMLGVIRSAAMKRDHRVEDPVDHLHRRLVEEHAAAVGLGARVAHAPDAAPSGPA